MEESKLAMFPELVWSSVSILCIGPDLGLRAFEGSLQLFSAIMLKIGKFVENFDGSNIAEDLLEASRPATLGADFNGAFDLVRQGVGLAKGCDAAAIRVLKEGIILFASPALRPVMRLFWDSGSRQERFQLTLMAAVPSYAKMIANDDVFATESDAIGFCSIAKKLSEPSSAMVDHPETIHAKLAVSFSQTWSKNMAKRSLLQIFQMLKSEMAPVRCVSSRMVLALMDIPHAKWLLHHDASDGGLRDNVKQILDRLLKRREDTWQYILPAVHSAALPGNTMQHGRSGSADASQGQLKDSRETPFSAGENTDPNPMLI
eukprot:g865.t1